MVAIKRLTLLATLALLVAACGGPTISDLTGGGGDDDDTVPTPPPGPDASFTITASPISIELRELKKLDVTVQSYNGFAGDVTVTATDLPAGVTAAGPIVIAVAANASATGQIDLTSNNSIALPGNYGAAKIDGVSAALTATDDLSLTISPVFRMDTKVAVGTGMVRDVWGVNLDANGDTVLDSDASNEGIVIHHGGNPVTVNFRNMDTITHLIHGNGQRGMIHGDQGNNQAAGAAGVTQTRTLTPVNANDTITINFYCHTHGADLNQPGRITLKP